MFVVRLTQPANQDELKNAEDYLEAKLESKLGRRVPVLALPAYIERDPGQSSALEGIDNRLCEIEAKLDFLLESIASEEEEEEKLTLDGDPAGGERDQTQSLG